MSFSMELKEKRTRLQSNSPQHEQHDWLVVGPEDHAIADANQSPSTSVKPVFDRFMTEWVETSEFIPDHSHV